MQDRLATVSPKDFNPEGKRDGAVRRSGTYGGGAATGDWAGSSVLQPAGMERLQAQAGQKPPERLREM